VTSSHAPLGLGTSSWVLISVVLLLVVASALAYLW
jgi:hypothetical protein